MWGLRFFVSMFVEPGEKKVRGQFRDGVDGCVSGVVTCEVPLQHYLSQEKIDVSWSPMHSADRAGKVRLSMIRGLLSLKFATS